MTMEPNEEIHGDPSHDLDLVTVFSVANTQSSFEAQTVLAMLQASGIEAELTGDARLPNLAYEVRVARKDAAAAKALIAEAQAFGPDAAAAAELETEQS
jgi:hypothetical protein